MFRQSLPRNKASWGKGRVNAGLGDMEKMGPSSTISSRKCPVQILTGLISRHLRKSQGKQESAGINSFSAQDLRLLHFLSTSGSKQE